MLLAARELSLFRDPARYCRTCCAPYAIYYSYNRSLVVRLYYVYMQCYAVSSNIADVSTPANGANKVRVAYFLYNLRQYQAVRCRLLVNNG